MNKDDTKQTIGILAYGSLIADPDWEIAEVLTGTSIDVTTPFPVEFARSSDSRGGAPTLVPDKRGCPVRAQIFVVDTSVDDACDRLYRREIHDVGSGKRYEHSDYPRPNKVTVKRQEPFAGVDVVLYTQIRANIDKLSAARLAELAITSVARADEDEDGISYLMNAIKCGIRTPLTDAYEAAIIRRTGAADLTGALARERAKVKGS